MKRAPRSDRSRTVALGAKFSPSEAANLRAKASRSGITVSTLLHRLVLKGVVNPRPKIDPIAIEQWRKLAPMASNLNQLTRNSNLGIFQGSQAVASSLSELLVELSAIRNHLIGGGGAKS